MPWGAHSRNSRFCLYPCYYRPPTAVTFTLALIRTSNAVILCCECEMIGMYSSNILPDILLQVARVQADQARKRADSLQFRLIEEAPHKEEVMSRAWAQQQVWRM